MLSDLACLTGKLNGTEPPLINYIGAFIAFAMYYCAVYLLYYFLSICILFSHILSYLISFLIVFSQIVLMHFFLLYKTL